MSERGVDNKKWLWKNDPILNRFSFEFYNKISINPTYHTIYAMLQQGVDEYRIIEELLKLNEKLSNDLIKLNEKKIPKYIIKDERKRI